MEKKDEISICTLAMHLRLNEQTNKVQLVVEDI